MCMPSQPSTSCDDRRVTPDINRRAAVLAVVVAAILFGTTGTAIELGPDGVSPWGVGTLRIVIGAASLWVLARSLPRRTQLRGTTGRHLVLGAIGVAAYQPGFFLGTQRLGVALGTMIALTSGPVAAGLIEGITSRRRPQRPWVIGTLVMTIGVVLVIAGRSGFAGITVDALGLLGSVIAGVGYAVYASMARRAVVAGVDSTVALAWEHTLGALMLIPGLWFVSLDWLEDGSSIVMLAHLGVITVGVAYVLYGIGLRTLDSSTAVSITLVEPLTATMLAVVVLDERLGPRGWVGAVIVLIGLAVVGRNSTSTPNATSMVP
jgi:DME family drug/metabolite transporter